MQIIPSRILSWYWGQQYDAVGARLKTLEITKHDLLLDTRKQVEAIQRERQKLSNRRAWVQSRLLQHIQLN